MNQERTFWILDPTVLRQIRMPEFGWYELVLLAATGAFFALYLFAVWYLDRRFTRKIKRDQKAADLERRLEQARLTQEERAALYALAGTRHEAKLLDFLTDPVAFEVRVHEALEAGEAAGLDFLPRLRAHLGYQSNNFFVPLISTRQLLPEDGVRLSWQNSAQPTHHYGTVEAVGASTFTIRLGGAGLDPAEFHAGELELFAMRGQDLEHRFPFLPAEPLRNPARIVLRHALARLDRRPRQIRLPLLVEVIYEERSAHGRAADALDPDLAPGEPERGMLYDLSDGGFALVARRAHALGRMLRLTVPLRRPGRQLLLLGRVAACRPLGGEQWMVHATLRGLSRKQRHFLHQVVMHEQHRRLKTFARIRPRKAKAG
jgi:hypothetical protein